MKYSFECDEIINCADCPLCNGSDDCVLQSGESFETFDEQISNCPLRVEG